MINANVKNVVLFLQQKAEENTENHAIKMTHQVPVLVQVQNLIVIRNVIIAKTEIL
jgi:hypothetical protein